MAIKIIKFDLPINGSKVTTLEALRDNLTDEIVQLARSGQLERWFKSRQMQAQAQAVAAAVSQNKKDKALFLALCKVLEVEVHPDDVSAIFDAPSKAGQPVKGGKYFGLYEELKENHQKMIEKLTLRIADLENAITETIEKDIQSYWERGVQKATFRDGKYPTKLENSIKKTE